MSDDKINSPPETPLSSSIDIYTRHHEFFKHYAADIQRAAIALLLLGKLYADFFWYFLLFVKIFLIEEQYVSNVLTMTGWRKESNIINN